MNDVIRYRHVIPKLVTGGISVEHLYTHDISFIDDLLAQFNVESKGARMKLAGSATRLSNVLYVQGSGSYLFVKGSKLHDRLKRIGQAPTKKQLLVILQDQLKTEVEHNWEDEFASFEIRSLPANDREILEKKKRLIDWQKDVANFVYAHVLLNSSLVQAVHIYGTRKIITQDGTKVFTSLWYGKLLSVAEKIRREANDDDDQPRKIAIVDMGTGEIKRYFCTCLHDDNDPTVASTEEIKDDANALCTRIRELVTKLCGYNDPPHAEAAGGDDFGSPPGSPVPVSTLGRRRRRNQARGPETTFKQLQDATDAVKVCILGPKDTLSRYAEHDVHVIGTSILRRNLDKEIKAAIAALNGTWREDSHLHVQTIRKALFGNIELVKDKAWKPPFSTAGLSDFLSKEGIESMDFTIIRKDQEAVFESKALNNAIEVDDTDHIPKHIRTTDRSEVATLAWGAGSTQGWVHRNRISSQGSESTAKDEGEKLEQMNIGLKDIHYWIFQHYTAVGEWQGDVPDKPETVRELLRNVREELKDVVDAKSSSTDPIEFYDCDYSRHYR